MKLVHIDEQNIEKYWAQMGPLLENACERSNGRFSVRSSLDQMIGGLWQW